MGYEYYVGIDEVMRCRYLRKIIRGICEISSKWGGGILDHTEYMVLPILLRNSDHMGSLAMLVEHRQPLVLFCPLSQRGVGGI